MVYWEVSKRLGNGIFSLCSLMLFEDECGKGEVLKSFFEGELVIVIVVDGCMHPSFTVLAFLTSHEAGE